MRKSNASLSAATAGGATQIEDGDIAPLNRQPRQPVVGLCL